MYHHVPPSHREVGTCWFTLVRSSVSLCAVFCAVSLPFISLQRVLSYRLSNTRRWPNAGLMLAHRLRRWADNSPVLRYHVVFGATLNVGQRHRQRANINPVLVQSIVHVLYRQHADKGTMKYWLGQNGYWPATALLAQHKIDIGSVSAVMAASSKLQAIPDQLLFPTNTKRLYNICTTSAERLRRWSSIMQMFCVYWVELSPVNMRRWTSTGLMLGQRRRWWASIGPALSQRRVCWECWQVFRTKTE